MPKPVITAFIIFHTLAISLAAIAPFPARNVLFTPFAPYIQFFSLYQDWQMFRAAPRLYISISALVRFGDGTAVVWEFPRMEDLNVIEQAYQARYRKLTTGYVSDPRFRPIWRDIAIWVARLDFGPGKRPVSIDLIKNWSEIPPPAEGLGKPVPPPTNRERFFHYVIQPEDIR